MKLYKGNYEAKLEFSGGGGLKLKLCLGKGWLFSGTTQECSSNI